jgi:hypothetical protein
MIDAHHPRTVRHVKQRVAPARRGNDRIAALGGAEQQPMEQTPSQRTANELISAERALTEAQNRYLTARRAWTDAIRRDDEASTDGVTAAQAELNAAEATRDYAIGRIDELRLRLQAERRREALVQTVVGQQVAHDEARRRIDDAGRGTSFIGRLLRRAGR